MTFRSVPSTRYGDGGLDRIGLDCYKFIYFYFIYLFLTGLPGNIKRLQPHPWGDTVTIIFYILFHPMGGDQAYTQTR